MKTRFAPSPSGYLHLGNIRTALFNALLARHCNGVFLLRIEDTDASRSETVHYSAIEDDLRWLGLDWQEGPYVQSERREIYRQYYDRLAEKDLAYPCFCSEQALKLARKAQRARGEPPRYPGTCAELSGHEVQARLEQGFKPSFRFRVPKGESIAFEDQVRGPQRFETDRIGDFIIRRSDGAPAFFFTNALDDALMGVTHVLRGEDHLTNTPRQLMLLQALRLEAPCYGHISLITGEDGSPLSKRRGAQSVKDLREAGYLPEAVNNYLARLGHSYSRDDALTLAELAEGFDLAHLGRAPAHYDGAQLRHWQKEEVLRADHGRLAAWLDGQGIDLPQGLDKQRPAFIDLVRENVALPADAAMLAKMIFSDTIEYAIDADAAVLAAGADYYRAAIESFEETLGEYEPMIAGIRSRTGLKGKPLFMPLRAALTGQLHGPELARVLALMPQALIQRRFESALELIAGH